jgi:hypothetical protein
MIGLHRWARVVGLAAMLTGWGCADAAAQVHALGPDSFLVAVPIRDTVEIHRDLAEAAQAKTEAEQGRMSAERLRSSAEARLARKDGEIDGIKAREKTAKSQKQAGEIAALEAERKAAEREKDLIKRRQSLRQAEIELEKKRTELADISRQALELELQLAVRRLDQERAGNPGGPAGARNRQVLGDLEKRTLEVQRQEVDKSKEVADRRKEIIKRRLEILEAQRKFVTGT